MSAPQWKASVFISSPGLFVFWRRLRSAPFPRASRAILSTVIGTEEAMKPEDRLTGYMANYVVQASVLLTKCLKQNGALLPGQFERALQETIEHPDAQRERPDY